MKNFKTIAIALLVAFSTIAVSAQTKKVYRKKATVVKADETLDSATIYYNLGWDNYKLDSFGAARYYWEKASYATGKSASKSAALHRLGLIQQNGQGVDTNLSMALDFYKRASGYAGKLGNSDAIKAIGGFYENGYGVEQNDAKALEWYLKAKQAGNEFTDDDIKRLQERLRNTKPVYKVKN